tara:strand:+ start:78 stop:1445 length:1368 start_codon:yes stop_codon:yes gene_type:complete
MANPKIKIKRSSVAGKVPHYPSTLDLGEFAINTADGKVFIAAGQAGVGVGTTVREVGVSTENVLIQTLQVDGNSDLNGALDVDGHTNLDNVSVAGVVTFSGNVKFGAQVQDGDGGFGSNGQLLSSDGTDTKWISVGSIAAGAAASIGVSADSVNATRFPTFVSGSTGNRFVRVDTTYNYNPSTKTLQVAKINNLNSVGLTTVGGYTFPLIADDGSNGQVLATDGNGTLSFVTAESGSGTATTISQNSYTATAGQTTFTLPNLHDDGTKTYPVEVFFNGIRARVGAGASFDYQLSGTQQIVFNYGLDVGTRVVTKVGYGHTIDERQFTASEGDTTFTITGEQATQNKFHCYLNGILLRRGTDYTAGSPIVLAVAAKAGDEVAIINANAEEFFTANEGQTKFTATDTSTTSDNTQVYLNGIFMEIGTDYTLGNPSVTVINPATGLTAGDNFDIVITR